jgi:hypothetical protein
VSDGASSVTVEPLAQPRDGQTTAQLSTTDDSGPAQTQLTNRRSSRDEPAQLSTGPRTAQGPQELSRPAEGRTAAIERVEGADRCDAAMPKDERSDECKRVIESRAEDYSRAPPTQLSPEQRLLRDQQLETVGNDLTEASRRLASSGTDDNSIESQAIASIVLGQGQEPREQQPAKEEDPATAAAAQAVLQMLTVIQPQN